MLFNILLGLAAFGGLLVLFGFVAMMWDIAIGSVSDDWIMRPFGFGMAFGVVFGLAAAIVGTHTAPVLSRGVIADKVHRSYTTMIMVGKVFVPSHVETWDLVSTEGAACSVSAAAFDQYRAGDAVVCAWGRP